MFGVWDAAEEGAILGQSSGTSCTKDGQRYPWDGVFFASGIMNSQETKSHFNPTLSSTIL